MNTKHFTAFFFPIFSAHNLLYSFVNSWNGTKEYFSQEVIEIIFSIFQRFMGPDELGIYFGKHSDLLVTNEAKCIFYIRRFFSRKNQLSPLISLKSLIFYSSVNCGDGGCHFRRNFGALFNFHIILSMRGNKMDTILRADPFELINMILCRWKPI